jgi:dethiobiotin synthetase
MRPVFISGTGTDVGKTLASVIVVNALKADYWKPVQAGYEDGTDSQFVQRMVVSNSSVIHPEAYMLKLPASPHLAARKEGIEIDLNKITAALPVTKNPLVIEGAGGMMVPLNDREFVTDLIAKLNARVVLVSRNYLGSINHSLLTAALCKQKNIDVIGWLFNDVYGEYEEQIASWSGYPVIGKIARLQEISARNLSIQTDLLKESITMAVMKSS